MELGLDKSRHKTKRKRLSGALPDDVRAGTTKDLALKIRALSSSDKNKAENKLRLAVGLAGRATEGDFGHDALQDVANTLALALKEHPLPWPKPKPESGEEGKTTGTTMNVREPAGPYMELASLVRYEHVEASLDDEQYRAAMSRLEADDR